MRKTHFPLTRKLIFSFLQTQHRNVATNSILLFNGFVKASELIEKLEQRLEQGNEIVDEFFQKVGQKMTHLGPNSTDNHENDSSYTAPEYVDSHSSSNIEGNIDQLDASGASYGTEGHVDHSAYDNQDAKPHQTTKKELEGHTVEDHNKGYGRHDLKTINFPVKG
ncbi:hypothetical protein Avbf_15684 [Armadillidium vulgare]|nr:hypothetical protein Avbf_15684 [Armadillidium vulgare]